MRILFVTHHFQPEPNFFVGLPFAKELMRRGHEVEVLTGFPYYPAGRIYPGYKVRMLQREIMDGVPVNRVALYPSHDKSSFRRTLTYVSHAISSSTIGAWVVKKADVAYIGQGPITVGWPALVLKGLRRIPYVFHIMDLWPDTLEATGMFSNRLGIWAVHRFCNCTYRHASKVIVYTPGVREKLRQRGVPETKMELMYNWCDDALICRDPKDEKLADSLGMTGKFNIVFAGNMGKAQAMDTVLEAARILAAEHPDIQFLLIGGGVDVDGLKAAAAQIGLTNVVFLPRRPIEEIGPILRCADVLLVHLKDEPVFEITIPSKTQAYMAIGRPILMAVRGDAASLVEEARAGVSCVPENPVAMAEAVKQLYSMDKARREAMGENGMRFYDSKLSFRAAVDRFERIFEEVARKGRSH